MLKKIIRFFKRHPRLPQVGDIYGEDMCGKPYTRIKILSVDKDNPYLVKYLFTKSGIIELVIMEYILTKDIRDMPYLKFKRNESYPK